MQRHAEEGARIIDRLGFLNDAVPAIRHHHERFDGTGYPDRLQGEEIPLGARIIHVADALDSMLTTRIYRAARPAEEALDELRRAAGTPVLPALRRRARADPAARGPGRRGRPRARARRCRSDRPLTLACVLHLGRSCSTILGTWRASPSYRALAGIDRKALAEFQAGIRKRYTDEQILEELRRVGEAAGALADDARVRGRPGDAVHPQTVIEHFGSWNEAKRDGGPRSAALCDARGAARPAAGPRGGARPGPDGARHRGAPRPDAVEVALLAHVRLAGERAPRGRLRRPGGGGEARARPRAGRRAGAEAEAAPEVRRLGGGPPRRRRRS